MHSQNGDEIHVLALRGSLRSGSFDQALIRAARELARELAGGELVGVLRGAFGIALDPQEEARSRSIYEPDHEDHKNHEDGGLS